MRGALAVFLKASAGGSTMRTRYARPASDEASKGGFVDSDTTLLGFGAGYIYRARFRALPAEAPHKRRGGVETYKQQYFEPLKDLGRNWWRCQIGWNRLIVEATRSENPCVPG